MASTQASPYHDYSFNVLILGDPKAGKSEIVKHIGQSIDLKTLQINLNINEHKPGIIEPGRPIRNYDCIIICIDVTNENSYNQIKDWLRMLSIKPFNLLIATKCDQDETKRIIPTIQLQALSEGIKIPFIETSAKSKLNINDLGLIIAKGILSKNYPYAELLGTIQQGIMNTFDNKIQSSMCFFAKNTELPNPIKSLLEADDFRDFISIAQNLPAEQIPVLKNSRSNQLRDFCVTLKKAALGIELEYKTERSEEIGIRHILVYSEEVERILNDALSDIIGTILTNDEYHSLTIQRF